MDLDGFDFGNGFPGSNHHHHQPQQQQRRYTTTTSTNAPTAEGYDPNGVSGSVGAIVGGSSLGYNNSSTHHAVHGANIVGTDIATSPLNAAIHHMPPTGTSVFNHNYSTTRGSVSAAAGTAAASVHGGYQHQQALSVTQLQQQQRHFRHHHSAAAALGPPPSVGAPPSHPHHRQQKMHRAVQNQHHLLSQQRQQQMKLLSSRGGGGGGTTAQAGYSRSSKTSSNNASYSRNRKLEPIRAEPWMEQMQLSIPDLSTETMSGTAVIRRLQERTHEVVSRYLPCVDFLVNCQQELRKGLQDATTKQIYHNMLRNKLTPLQFYAQYIERLPEKFNRKYRHVMKPEHLRDAETGIQELCKNARNVPPREGCAGVKNAFLGGMKEGESWGLRKWLSKHGSALMICNDVECILQAAKKLDKNGSDTIQLARKIRPLGEASYKKLKKDVPPSYQEHSSAHPFLPFFHRLESALRGVSRFDPEEDDVICLDDDDDDDDDEVQVVDTAPRKPEPTKRRPSLNNSQHRKRKAVALTIVDDDDDDDTGKGSHSAGSGGTRKSAAKEMSKPRSPAKKRAKSSAASTAAEDHSYSDTNPTGNSSLIADVAAEIDGESDYMKDLLQSLKDDTDDDFNFSEIDDKPTPLLVEGNVNEFDFPSSLDCIAFYFEREQEDLVRPSSFTAAGNNSFWDQVGPYAGVLRIFSTILSDQDSITYLTDPIDTTQKVRGVSYSSIIKNPLCFRDIVFALVAHFDADEMTVLGNSGNLKSSTLANWNMWRGNDLLMAIDLVFLNTLAYDKATVGPKSDVRTRVNRLRKSLWSGIKDTIKSHSPDADAETIKKLHPTRRGESAGFVVHKSSK